MPDARLILVVDDYADAREMYAEYLASSGYRVAEAARGDDAVRQARALQPDAIVMDLALPGLDGVSATRVLKNDPLTRHIPIVALTGRTEAEGVPARAAGCDRFLVKPCLPETVGEEIRRLLEGDTR